MSFTKILIANRGEIAVRINRTAQALGYSTVAVFSEADIDALHVRLADEAVLLGRASAGQSYLHIERLLAACRETGADAVHPGYGFLAENANFAEALADAGVVFIGPGVDAIRTMGNKAAAKRLMLGAGVPCIAGYQDVDQVVDQRDEVLLAEADKIGFPIMVKAVAGGGGRGMRLVDNAKAMPEALVSARSEAQSAFGSGILMLERAMEAARHIEVQVFADHHGNFVHLGERDCSIQRRHQKVFEESPSPSISAETREAMAAAAIAAARAIDYRGAGTVEFLCDGSGEFFFLEMNTRLQVEHPVTEMVTGLDLVAWQIAVAEGRALPLAQDQISLNGHAIEARLCAEAPGEGFKPQTGTIEVWREPEGAGIRVDTGVVSGSVIGPYYDSMIAKIIGFGHTREQARGNLQRALRDTQVFGLTTNKRFLLDCLSVERFVQGGVTTSFIQQAFGESGYSTPQVDPVFSCLAAIQLIRSSDRSWPEYLTGFSSSLPIDTQVSLLINDGARLHARVTNLADGRYQVEIDGVARTLSVRDVSATEIAFNCEGLSARVVCVDSADGGLYLNCGDEGFAVRDVSMDPPVDVDDAGTGQILAPMDGVIVRIETESRTRVAKGDLLLVLEAMKMEHRIVADVSGEVTEVLVATGDQVGTRSLLIVIESGE
jgi:geranyl-CoA carboxylase alpha subunit